MNRTTLTFFLLLGACMPLLGEQDASQSKPPVDAKKSEDEALQKLADRLVEGLKSDADVTVKQYADSGEGDFSDFDGTSYRSRVAFHDKKIPVCLKPGSLGCEQWFDEYHSTHGLSSEDSSLLETLVAESSDSLQMSTQERVEFGKKNLGSQNVSFGIWEIEVKDKEKSLILGVDKWSDPKRGTLDKKNISKMKIRDDIEEKIAELGKKTAEESILSSINEDDKKDAKTLTSPESLRIKAASLTRSLRNRILSNVGAARAGQADIEFALGDGVADCDAAMALEQDQGLGASIGGEDLLYRINRKRSDKELQRRYERCKEAFSKTYSEASSDLSKRPQEDSSVGGNPDEQIDIWRSKANLAVIDYAGMDNPNALGLPEGAQIEDEELKVRQSEYTEGARSLNQVKKTNWETINSYNDQLKDASDRMRDIASEYDGFEDSSDKIESYQIEKGAIDLVSLNGLTPANLKDLEGTSAEKLNIVKENKAVSTEQVDPNAILEGSASELVVRPAN